MERLETRRIVLSGMFIALVVVSTFINIPYPGSAGGLMHLGTLTLIIISLKFGKHYGALAGGIGMGLFDILGGWMAWAPGTIVVRLLMGYVIGVLSEDKNGQGSNIVKNVFAIIAGAVVMIVGYYFYEAIFLTTFKAALLSINGNIAQILIGFLGLLILPMIQGIENLKDN
ncbi:MAG: ECF transporter S component [Bacilli bacterium]|nr:ECF transporter S component [Bacilli bacterium]